MEHSFILNQLGKLMLKPIQSISFKYRIGSISKMFTSVLILRRSRRETILKSNIGSYYPTIECFKKITISNLLNHRAEFTTLPVMRNTFNTIPPHNQNLKWFAIMAKAKVILNPTVKLTIAILIMFCSVIFFKKYIINLWYYSKR
jgi:hypothetical protein